MVTAPKAAHHHHHHDAAAIVREIEHECDARGLRLTPLRREVLELVAKARRPVKAYDLLESLRDRHAGAAPPTVYRALDFLMDNGLVHRIESRNAFLACAHHHDETSAVAFLICETCGSVGEIPAAPLAKSFNEAARGTGFAPKLSVVEITGTCAHCQRAI